MMLFLLLKIRYQKYQTWKKNIFDYNKFRNNILNAKITEEKLVNKYGMNEKIKTISDKRRYKNINNKGRIKSRSR